MMSGHRALPDITSGPKVLKIFKIRIVRKSTFNTFKNRKKNPFFFYYFNLFFFFFGLEPLLTPNLCLGILRQLITRTWHVKCFRI